MIEVAVKCARECRSVKYHASGIREKRDKQREERCSVAAVRRRCPSIVPEGIKKGSKKNEGEKRKEK